MKYKKLVYLFIIPFHNANFTGGVASKAINNPVRQDANQETHRPLTLEFVKKCAAIAISKEIECENIPFAQVPKKLHEILNNDLYEKLKSVTVYGITFEKEIFPNNEIIWFQRPDKLLTPLTQD